LTTDFCHHSLALSVKMSILLYLPGLLVILFKRRGLVSTLRHVVTMAAMQAMLGMAFLVEDPRAYVQSSFDLSRVFLYKWTVNWRFVDEETFLSPTFARGLMIAHASALVLFGLFRWCKTEGVWGVLGRGLRRPSLPAGLTPLTPDCGSICSSHPTLYSDVPMLDVATVLFTSNLIGMLFARSLHYQFYSWYALQLPFLAWRTRYPLVVK
jgi:alpha-1,3-mannosyltransferase